MNEKWFPSSNVSSSQTFQWPWMIRWSMANQQTNLVLASLVIDSSPPAGFSQLAGSDTSHGCWNSTPPPSISPSLHPQIPTGRYPAGLAKADTAWPKEVQTTISIPPLSCLNLVGKTSSGGFDGRQYSLIKYMQWSWGIQLSFNIIIHFLAQGLVEISMSSLISDR